MAEFGGEYRDQLAIALSHGQADPHQQTGGDPQRFHPDFIGTHERERRDWDLREQVGEHIGRKEIDAATIELDCLTEWRLRRCTAGETAKALPRLGHVGHGNEDARQRQRSVGMREPAWLPDYGLGAMGEDLNAPL